MSTRRIRRSFLPIGSMPCPLDGTTRFEVCLVKSAHLDESLVIYLTKYHGREVGERSVGIHPAIANDIAAMLRAAASMARQVEVEGALEPKATMTTEAPPEARVDFSSNEDDDVNWGRSDPVPPVN